MSTTEPSPLALAGVDDYLGPRENRFFGEGYKRADHRLTGLETGMDSDGTRYARATASVGYPADWSRKGDTDQRPHLSTVDVLLLGVQLSELCLAHHLGLSEAQLRASWVRRARIKAGSTPVEDDLAGFAVAGRLAATSPSPGHPEREVSRLDCTVGTLRIRLEIDHPRPSGSIALAGAGLTDDQRRTFGDAYKSRRQLVEQVTVSPDRRHTTASVRLHTWAAATEPGVGVEGDFQPAVGLIDAFVTALQLGQVMLYELDAVARADSDTLWMRSTLFEADSPYRPVQDSHPITAALEDATLLHTSEGLTWRRADITAALAGIRVTCSVAHRLP